MFSASEMKIFAFNNGTADVFADPLAINRALARLLDGIPDKVVADTRADNLLAAADATEKLTTAVRTAFGLPAFSTTDGSGMTDEMVIAVWNQFQDWLDAKKKRDDSSRTFAPPEPAVFFQDQSGTPTVLVSG